MLNSAHLCIPMENLLGTSVKIVISWLGFSWDSLIPAGDFRCEGKCRIVPINVESFFLEKHLDRMDANPNLRKNLHVFRNNSHSIMYGLENKIFL